MAGRVLTEEDFKEGKDKEDTSKTPKPDEKVEPKPDEVIEFKGKEKEEPEEKVEPSEDKEEPQPKDDGKKYKYASMDEFDKAYKEAEKKMHEATTEKSKLERELAQFKKPPEKPAVTLEEKIREVTKQTVSRIKTMPEDTPNRDDEIAYLWAKNASEIEDLKYEHRRTKEESERNTIKKIYDQATKEGLKTDEELDYFSYRYSKTDPSLSIEDRTSQAIEATKMGLGKLREGVVKDVEKDKKDKEDLKVLGRGSSRTVKSEKGEEKPMSMSQQLAELNEKRKLKKEDIW